MQLWLIGDLEMLEKFWKIGIKIEMLLFMQKVVKQLLIYDLNIFRVVIKVKKIIVYVVFYQLSKIKIIKFVWI